MTSNVQKGISLYSAALVFFPIACVLSVFCQVVLWRGMPPVPVTPEFVLDFMSITGLGGIATFGSFYLIMKRHSGTMANIIRSLAALATSGSLVLFVLWLMTIAQFAIEARG